MTLKTLKIKIDSILKDVKFLRWGYYHPRKFFISRSSGLDGRLALICQEDIVNGKLYLSITSTGELVLSDKNGNNLIVISQSGTLNIQNSTLNLINNGKKTTITYNTDGSVRVANNAGVQVLRITENGNLEAIEKVIFRNSVRLETGSEIPTAGVASGSAYLQGGTPNPLWLRTSDNGWVNVDTNKIKV